MKNEEANTFITTRNIENISFSIHEDAAFRLHTILLETQRLKNSKAEHSTQPLLFIHVLSFTL